MRYNPKVTIGFCVKNSEVTVKEAIDSVVSQDYPHELMELIVVDGYSKDKTISIVEKRLSNTDINVEFFYENEGLGEARQIVVNNALGDYIIWVDGDIVLGKNYITKLVELMDRNPHLAVARGRFRMRTKENLVATLESIDWIVMTDREQKVSSEQEFHCAGGSIYRTKAARQVGGFDRHFKGALEDWDIEHRMKRIGWLTAFANDAEFYHRLKQTWNELWKENFWYGYGGHYFLHKCQRSISASAFFTGLQRPFDAYNLTHRKIVFLISLQYYFKKIAWYFGFLKAHTDGYGHSLGKT